MSGEINGFRINKSLVRNILSDRSLSLARACVIMLCVIVWNDDKMHRACVYVCVHVCVCV